MKPVFIFWALLFFISSSWAEGFQEKDFIGSWSNQRQEYNTVGKFFLDKDGRALLNIGLATIKLNWKYDSEKKHLILSTLDKPGSKQTLNTYDIVFDVTIKSFVALRKGEETFPYYHISHEIDPRLLAYIRK